LKKIENLNASPAIKARARELVVEYARADRNRCALDAMKILNNLHKLGYEVFADIPGVLTIKYIGGQNVQVRGV
jgi:hypothetical protein